MSSHTIRSSAEAAAYYQQHGYAPGAIETLTRSFGDLSVRPRKRFLDTDYPDLREDQSMSSGDRHFSDTSSFGSAAYSDISDAGIALAEEADREYFNPCRFAKLEQVVTSKTLVIGLVALCLVSGIYLMGLPNTEQVEEKSYQEGMQQAVSAIHYAMDYVDNFTPIKVKDLFTQFINKRG
jgi:hypothetical protein